MFLHHAPSNPQTMIRIGMACLAIALVWPRFLNPTPHLDPDWVDGLRGVLFGVGISLNLWAARLLGRGRHGDGS